MESGPVVGTQMLRSWAPTGIIVIDPSNSDQAEPIHNTTSILVVSEDLRLFMALGADVPPLSLASLLQVQFQHSDIGIDVLIT